VSINQVHELLALSQSQEVIWQSCNDLLRHMAKLGNIVAETLLRMQMFPSLAARETYVVETTFAAWKL